MNTPAFASVERLSANSATHARPGGMGPIRMEQGTAFRVWAPHVERVAVIGSFNDWNEQSDMMELEDGGNWFVHCPSAISGDEYKFRLYAGQRSWDRVDPRARQVTNSVGSGVIPSWDFDWEDDCFQMPAWNEAVIYEMHVGTFQRPAGQEVGSFDQIARHFDHLKKLGVNVLQLMPIAEFAGDLSWGYNPAHPYAIESAYGGPEAFKRLVKKAHQNGFAIIVDVVYNHFGPSDLNLWQFDGWQENGKGGIYFYNDYRSATPWGDTRPDYGRGEVRSYLRDNALMWLEEYHVDGLRFDMTLYIRSVDGQSEIAEGWGLAQWINREVSQFQPAALTVAEDLQNNGYLTKDESAGGAGFGTQWDAGFVHPVRDVLTVVDDASRDMNKICSALSHHYNGDVFQRVVYTESHDEVANGSARVPSEVDPDNPDSRHAQKRATLGSVLVMTAPGIPMLFQGQEFLETGWFQDSEALDWHRKEQFFGIVQLHSDLIRLRKDRQGPTSGLSAQGLWIHHVNHDSKVVSWQRFDQTVEHPGTVVIVANFSAQQWDDYQIGVPDQGPWQSRFNSDATVYSQAFDDAQQQAVFQGTGEARDGQRDSIRLTLAPYSAMILSRQ